MSQIYRRRHLLKQSIRAVSGFSVVGLSNKVLARDRNNLSMQTIVSDLERHFIYHLSFTIYPPSRT